MRQTKPRSRSWKVFAALAVVVVGAVGVLTWDAGSIRKLLAGPLRLWPRAPPVAPPTASEAAQLARSGNAFAADLWREALSTSPGNLVISPASITSALGMAWGGAQGDTAAELKQVLHFEGTSDEVMSSAGRLLQSWHTSEGPITLRVANRLFGERTFTFEKSYLDKVHASYGAPLEPVDFRDDVETTRRHINEWVAEQTEELIQQVLPPGSLVPRETRLVLVNAIYFKADWDNPFDEKRTRPKPFYVTPATPKNVPMMHRDEEDLFAELDDVKVLELPYEGGEMAMTFVLPNAVDGLAAVERKLTEEQLDQWVRALRRRSVEVALPRFQVDPTSTMKLGEALKRLGMTRAFDRELADFTGIANPLDPRDRLYIDEVLHKAFIKLDETGTEAAAATAVTMLVTTSVKVPKVFLADHPFLFFLRDTRSGMILFMGRIADP